MVKDLTVPQVLRVIAIDPSTTNMGVCVMDVDLSKRTPFKLVYVNTIKGDRVLYDIPEQYDDTINGTGVMARCYGLARALGGIIDTYLTDWVDKACKFVKVCVTAIIEDNYLGRSPGTFKQLIQAVAMLQTPFVERGIHVSTVTPIPPKETVGVVAKKSEKEDVHNGVMAYEHLDSEGFDLKVIDEHSSDATAIALYRCEIIAKDYGVFYA